MLSDKEIAAQLPLVLDSTDFKFLGERYVGKVRDTYRHGDTLFLVTTDRLSAFDKIVTSVPFKGEVLTALACYWFDKTSHIIPNHIIDRPDPNVIVARAAAVFPIEVVIRAYLAGSAWKDYQAGKSLSGIKLCPGYRRNQKLEGPIVTPFTKAQQGEHDQPISEHELIRKGLITERHWNIVREAAHELFAFAAEEVSKRGLILVDTKYEFGLAGDEVIVLDEMHTLDSSRFWRKSTYEGRFNAGEDPEMLDKQPVREWLLSQGYEGEGRPPPFSDQKRVDIAKHYLAACEEISGLQLNPAVGPVEARIRDKLGIYLSGINAREQV